MVQSVVMALETIKLVELDYGYNPTDAPLLKVRESQEMEWPTRCRAVIRSFEIRSRVFALLLRAGWNRNK
jgi:hypothetical protein